MRDRRQVVEDEQRWQWAFDKTVWSRSGAVFEWMGFSVGERPRPAHLVGLCWCRLDVGGFGMTESKASKTTDGCAVLSLKADSLGRSS